MACQTMVSGMKFSINGTQNSHGNKLNKLKLNSKKSPWNALKNSYNQ